MSAIRHGLTHLLDFSGRDPSGRFWPWAVTVLCTVGGTWFLSFGAVMMQGVWEMARYAEAHPDQVEVIRNGSKVTYRMKEAVPGVGVEPVWLLGLCGAFGLLLVGLLAAAVTRRLHDTGRSGWWAAMPATLLFSGFALLLAVFQLEGFVWFALGFVNNGLYLLSLLALLLFLAGRSDPDANAYGPVPSAT